MDTSKLKKSSQATESESLQKDYESSIEKLLVAMDGFTLSLAKEAEREKELKKRLSLDESYIKELEAKIPSTKDYSRIAGGVEEIKTKLLEEIQLKEYGAVCILFFLFLQAIPVIIKIIPVEIVACVISQDISFNFPSFAGTVIPFLMLCSKRNRKAQILLPYMIASILITYSQCFLSVVPWTSNTIGLIMYGTLYGFTWFTIELIYNKREAKHD